VASAQILQTQEAPTLEPNRELVVVLQPEGQLSQLAPAGRQFASTGIQDALNEFNATMHATFAAALARQANDAKFGVPPGALDQEDLSRFFSIKAPEEAMDDLADRLRQLPQVAASYVKPPAELPQLPNQPPVNNMTTNAAPAAAVTPDFTPHQIYLNSAPDGVDARYAWTLGGGKGEKITVIDIEGDWRLTHEDLKLPPNALLGGTLARNLDWRNHGTAVLGEIAARDNSIGVTGICPNANIKVMSVFGWPSGTSTSAAIAQAATVLEAGDILLVEIHRAGPRFAFQPRADQRGYIAVEWWPDDFAAIQFATNRGIIVVEPAGNGAEDLDDILYDTPANGFPPGWTNPFKRTNRDSGAVVVGAGAPPPGTHGRQYGPDRSRLYFSNWGNMVDAQGWGEEVTTCGYGNLQGGATEDVWYTDNFGGTSSASPIVVGALACVQGIRRAQGRSSLTPSDARALLTNTGSPQQPSITAPLNQRIGTRPDLKELVQKMPP
jgi:subtilisin family serine protease